MPATHDIIIALLLTTVAGLSTGIGALVAFFTRATDTRVLSAALGLSAGVMVYVSMMELLPEAFATLGRAFDERTGEAVTLLTFFGGIALIALIDHFVPEDENPHEMHSPGEFSKPADGHHMRRTAMMLTLAIGIHNFPEGMATFRSRRTRRRPADCRRYRNPQHPRGHSRLCADLPFERQPQKSLRLHLGFRPRRNCGRDCRHGLPIPLLDPGNQRILPRCSRRSDGLHLI